MPIDDIVVKELARLRREVNELKATLPGSFSTTKSQRKALSKHIEDLDKQIAKKKVPPPRKIVPNPLKVGQIVAIPDSFSKKKGRIIGMACRLALPSIRECSPKKCEHKHKSYVWVIWPNDKISAYRFDKLIVMSEDDLKPKIGRELSGKIGPWSFDAATKLWKKDSDDKSYTEDEFNDIMFYETHPYAKDESADLMKFIMRGG